MIKALVSVYPDLASVIAMNYTCRLSRVLKMGIQPIFVKEPEEGEKAPGVGWVRKTWENSLLEVEQEAMEKLIEAEKSEYAILSNLQVLFGNRDEAILDNLLEQSYDLFVEGCVSRFEKSALLQRARSKLYRNLPCPVIIVRNLIDFKKVLIIVEESQPVKKIMPPLIKIFSEVKDLHCDLLYCQIIDSGPLEPIAPPEGIFAKIEKMFGSEGLSPQTTFALRGTPKDLAHQIEEYSMVATSMPKNPDKHNGLLELLSDTPSPILLCKQ